MIVGLSDRLDVSVFLGRLEGKMITLIGRAFAPTSRYKFVPVGSRFAAHSFALGRVLLADVSEENLENPKRRRSFFIPRRDQEVGIGR